MSKITRRRFFEDSLFATAAAAAASAIPTESSAGTLGAPARAAGPNDTIRVACIGVRGQGNGHLNGFLGMKDVEVAAICDADAVIGQTRCDAAEKSSGKRPRFEQDMRKVFDDKSIDVVSIATPNHWHALAAIWAMQSGKDVYVEKPVSHNVSEGRRMVQAARKLGRICQTGTQCRSSAGVRGAIEYIKSGKLGDVNLARGLCYKKRDSIGKVGEGKPPEGVDYNLWCGPAPMKPLTRKNLHYDWHWAWDTGNGDLGNQGIHQMDIARWGLGVNTLANSVLGLGGRFGYEDDGETPNTELIFLDYGPKQLVFEVRGLKTDSLQGAGVGVIFYGSDGIIVNPSYQSSTVFDASGNKLETFTDKDPFPTHQRNFLAAVRSRKHTELAADIEQGHLSSALCHLGNISYRLGSQVPFNGNSKSFGDDKAAYETFARFEQHLAANGVPMETSQFTLGRRLTLDPKRELFLDADDANALLTRDYRAPFVVPKEV